MPNRLLRALSLFFLLFLAGASAQARVDICYAGGRLLPNFQLNGNGTLNDQNLVVTRNISNQRSSIVYKTPLATSGDISIRMRLRIGDNVGGGADGMAFTMHNHSSGINALGLAGEGIGYQGIGNSVTVEFDTYNNGSRNDGNDNHVAILTNGNPTHAVNDPLKVTPSFSLKSGTAFYTWIDYNASQTRLSVYVSQSSTKPGTPLITTTSVNVPNIVGSQMYLMFSGSTGGAQSTHEILELYASDEGQPGEACCTEDSQCSSSSLGPICDPVKKTCGECSAENLAYCSDEEKGCDLSQGVNVCRSKCEGNVTSQDPERCTSTDFPYCSARQQTRGSCLACDVSNGRPGAAACPSAAPACLDSGFCGLCSTNEDCTNSNAHAGGFCNTTTGRCESCSSNGQCAAGQTCQGGFCRECSSDNECGSGQYCDAVTFRCQAPLSAGEFLPEGVTCPSSRVTTVCADGACNAAQETCAMPVAPGNGCTDSKQCAENVCGSDGSCGCSADADCASNQYCAADTRLCQAKLASGSPLPDDPLHSGICTGPSDPTAAAACASGECNPETDTCGSSGGATCPGGPSECVSNTCSSSGRCVPSGGLGCYEDVDCSGGYHCDRNNLTCVADLPAGSPIPSDGIRTGVCAGAAVDACASGLCNIAVDTCAEPDRAMCSSNADCASNTCSASGRCIPPVNGCFADTDCSSSSFCDRDGLTCQAKLISGAPLPDDGDGYHDGVCAPELAAAVCASSACNAATNTCASPVNAPCSVASQCVVNVCGGNGQCGTPDSGACSADLAAVCQSATCAPSNVCVPAGGFGCYLDSDCGAEAICNQNALTCEPKRNNGEPIPSDGIRDGQCSEASAFACVSGQCNAATDTCGGAIGEACALASQCVVNVCGSNGSCGGANGQTCGGAESCQSGVCASGSGRCLPTADSCYLDAECGADEYCVRSTFTCAAKLGTGAPIPSDGIRDGSCEQADAVLACSSAQCNPATDTCADSNGEPCSVASECVTNVCGANGACGTEAAGTCSSSGATICQTGTCAPSGRCVPSEEGCYVDSDCAGVGGAGGAFCDRATLRCQLRLEAGAPIPSDGLHDGRCTPQNASAVCLDQFCNAATNTCARPNGEPCAVAQECVVNRCGSNGSCGLADGEGTCTPQTGSVLCQSGLCSQTGGLCVPPVASSCQVDEDCEASEHCDGQSWRCIADLPDGTPIPSDDLRDGSCSALVGAAVCASGACNVATDTCAKAVGAGCASASECAANVCSDGLCGFGPGEGACNVSTASLRCQSGTCSATGTCLGTGGCNIDADCPADRYCVIATNQCSERLPAGAPLPEGSCPANGLTSQCETGRCDSTTDHCGALTGEPCSGHGECLVGACGENGSCGLPDGAPGCGETSSTTLCQSGLCLDDVCSGLGACTEDGECGASAYCDEGQCRPKRPNGAPIPGGECTPDAGAALCASGHCSVHDQTCAALPGTDCALASQCAAGVCGQNGLCGHAEGSGPCSSLNANQLCQSGVCSESSALCVPQGGCGGNSECDGGSSYCDGETFLCAPKLPTGSPLPHDPLHDGECNSWTAQACASGMCNPATRTCAVGGGAACTSHADCLGNYCHEDGYCGRPDGTGPCRVGTRLSCRSETCSTSNFVCVPATDGCGSSSDCAEDEFCGSGQTCEQRLPEGAPVPGDGCPESGLSRTCESGWCNPQSGQCAVDNGQPCEGAATCASNVCGSDQRCGADDGASCDPGAPHVCRSGVCAGLAGSETCQPTQACSGHAECGESGYCDGSQCQTKRRPGQSLPNVGGAGGLCTVQAGLLFCQSGQCNVGTDTCAGDFGDPCADGRFCVANVCGQDGQCGLADGEGPCQPATGAFVCRSGSCSVGGACRPASTAGCAVDMDCGANEYCAFDSFTCAVKLPSGLAIPSDGLHDGLCSPENATAVCQSGACNAATNTCASENDVACTANAECVVNVCGSNGECGIARGDGVCSENAPERCQTGRCSELGDRCIDEQGGCVVDADCGSGQYCDATAERCADKLAPGAPLPSDPIHDGACSAALAMAVCDSGVCNPASDTCASVNGELCSTAGECVTNRCGSNGRCGLATGDAGCAVANQATDCQSGTCSLSGACVPANGCGVHADCRSDQYCDAATQQCAIKRAPGAALPEDCTSATGQAYCETGLCNATQDTCAAAAGEPCSGPAMCRTNHCGANGLCGVVDGQGPCTSNGQCQSGRCDVELGRCVPEASDGCAADVHCTDGFCDGATLRCRAKLPSGAPLPEDQLHGGACTAAVAEQVCESGRCNATSNTCADPNGGTCSDASECSSNLCDDNGRCGRDEGKTCTADGECQTNYCDGTTGQCSSSVTCDSHDECGSDQFCNPEKNRCQQRFEHGSACNLDAECESGGCRSGVCEAPRVTVTGGGFGCRTSAGPVPPEGTFAWLALLGVLLVIRRKRQAA